MERIGDKESKGKTVSIRALGVMQRISEPARLNPGCTTQAREICFRKAFAQTPKELR